jgi:hypothetical protein
MTKVSLTLIVILLFTAMPPAFAQKARVEGRVTDLSGQPLAKATVRMAMATAPEGLLVPPVYVSASDGSGNFVFDDLDADRYQLTVERAGYVRYEPGAIVDLSPSRTRAGIVVKMTPEALISGRILDEDGDPFPNAAVLLCRWNIAERRRQQQCNGVASAGPDGSFVIGNLPAGRYYLAGQDLKHVSSVSQRELPGRKGPEESYVTTYYPGVDDLSGAVALDLTAGAQIRGMDFRLRRSRVFRIAGKVLQPRGTLATISLLSKDQDGASARNSVQAATGVFEFNRLLPGAYIVLASAGNAFGRQVVTISGRSVEDVVIQLARGPDVDVRFRTEGSRPARITFSSAERNNYRPTSRQLPDGTLQFVGMQPGIYRIGVELTDAGTYVKSMRFGDQDVTRKPLDLTSGAGGILEVVLASHAAEMNGATTPGFAVTLWDDPDYIRTATADANGAFRFTNLPPGDYRVAAWENIDPGFSDLPEFLAKFESRATLLKLSENAHENADAVVIGHADIEVEANKFR